MKNEKENAVLTAQEKENQFNELILKEFKDFVKWNFDDISEIPIEIAKVQFEFVNLLSNQKDYGANVFQNELFTLKVLFVFFEKISKKAN